MIATLIEYDNIHLQIRRERNGITEAAGSEKESRVVCNTTSNIEGEPNHSL